MSSFHMRRSRLAQLSHAQLVELAAEACEGSHELKNKADALIAQVAPLPAWCVDILLSPDLLLQLFSSLGLSDHAAAGVCSTWSRAYTRQLRRRRYINPTRRRYIYPTKARLLGYDSTHGQRALCMLPGGVLATAVPEDEGQCAVEFVAARADSDRQALAAYQASSLAGRRFRLLMGLALTNDGLMACSIREPSAAHGATAPPGAVALYKFALDDSMDELATVPALADYGRGFTQIAVHQQTQRTYALGATRDGVGDDGRRHAVIILDSNLQVAAAVEATGGSGTPDALAFNDPIRDVAVHGDQVIVLTSGFHPEGSGLRLLDLDGRFVRTIAARQFRDPRRLTASDGRVFVVDHDEDVNRDFDDDEAWFEGHFVRKVLYVIDIQSGDILQSVRFRLAGVVSTVLVDRDEIYIASVHADKIIVLPFAGSDA